MILTTIIILALFAITGIFNTIMLHLVTNKLKRKNKDYDDLLDRHDKFVDSYGELINDLEELEKKYTELQKFFGRKVKR